MAHLLGAEGLHLEYPTKVVFDSITLGIEEGDRIGIVGRNGDGKSTLMKILAGRLDPDEGRVTSRSGTRIGMLDQADVLDPTQTVGQAVVGNRDEHEWAGDAKVRDVIGGLVAACGLILLVLTYGHGQIRRVLPVAPAQLIGIGLGCAAGAGILGLIAGRFEAGHQLKFGHAAPRQTTVTRPAGRRQSHELRGDSAIVPDRVKLPGKRP